MVLIVIAWAFGFVAGFTAATMALTLLGLGLAVVGLRRPNLGVFGLGMICTLDAVSRVFLLTGGLFRWNTFNYVLLFVLAISLPVLRKVLPVLPVRLAVLLALCLAVWLVFSEDRKNGFQHVIGFVSFFGVLAYFLRDGGHPSTWYWLGVVCGTLSAVGGFVFNLQKSDLPFINANALSYFPLTGLFAVCLAVSFTGRSRRQESILIVLAAINSAWIFFTGSRGAMILCVLCAAYLLSMTRGVGGKALLVSGVAIVSLFLMFQFGAESEFARHRIDKLLNAQESLAGRTSGRSDLVIGAWYMFLDNPLGVGTGGYAPAWARMTFVSGISSFAFGEERAAHSAWAKTLAENGLLGILLMAAFVGSFALVGWKNRGRGWLALGLLTTAIFTVAFTNTEFQGKGLWFLGAAVIAIFASRRGVGRIPGRTRRAS